MLVYVIVSAMMCCHWKSGKRIRDDVLTLDGGSGIFAPGNFRLFRECFTLLCELLRFLSRDIDSFKAGTSYLSMQGH